jgi:hypothetical protein
MMNRHYLQACSEVVQNSEYELGEILLVLGPLA